MPARTGQQYIDSLKRMSPCVYLNGRLVKDVTEEPVFAGPIKSIAELYDLQHDPRYRDFMLYESPTTGDPVHASFQVPKTRRSWSTSARRSSCARTTTSASWAARWTS